MPPLVLFEQDNCWKASPRQLIFINTDRSQSDGYIRLHERTGKDPGEAQKEEDIGQGEGGVVGGGGGVRAPVTGGPGSYKVCLFPSS